MRKWISLFVGMALLASWAVAQSAATQAQGAGSGAPASNPASSSAALDAGTAVQASLTKPVDAKKAKPGDAVEAKVQSDVKSAGRVVVPKGSKLVGHITEAKAREKGEADSALGIAFDRAVLKNGQTVAFQGVIRGVAAAPQVSASSADDIMAPGGGPNNPSPSGGAGAGLAGAAGATATGVANRVGNGVGSVAGNAGSMASTDAASTLDAAGANVAAATGSAVGVNAAGIRGLPGLQIDAAASNSTNGTVIVSHNRNVHLDSGTQLMIQVISQ